MTAERSVLIVVKDLFFQSRLASGLGHLGLRPDFAATAADLTTSAPAADLALVDLAARHLDPIEAIRIVRAVRPDLPIVAFGSHLDLELRRRAIDVGASRVVANSAMATDLARIIGRALAEPAGHSGSDQEKE